MKNITKRGFFLRHLILAAVFLFSQACKNTEGGKNNSGNTEESLPTKEDLKTHQPSSRNKPPQTIEEKFISAAEEGEKGSVEEIIRSGIQLVDNDLGIKALNKASTDEIKEVIATSMFEAFMQQYKKTSGFSLDFGSGLREFYKKNSNKKYDEFIKIVLASRRKKVGDAQLLADMAYVKESFQTLRDMGVDLNMVAKRAYGLSDDKDAGPLIVMLTAISPGDISEDFLVELTKALIDAGANVNEVDNRGHTALFYADNASRAGHDWQKKPFIALAKYLKTQGAISR